jgi:hypothetical protein
VGDERRQHPQIELIHFEGILRMAPSIRKRSPILPFDSMVRPRSRRQPGGCAMLASLRPKAGTMPQAHEVKPRR